MNNLPKPFLKEVAEVFVENYRNELVDYCFVTPNKRAGVFLMNYFKESIQESGSYGLTPEIVPISDFIEEFSQEVEASRIRQLLILYNVYQKIISDHTSEGDKANGKHLVDFNRFQFWGDIILNDFNDVDRYMVDAAQLFKNVENLKEISANYLTPEQIEVIKKYWNEELVPEPVKQFWNHIVYTSTGETTTTSNMKKNVAGFVKLWQVMFEIYTEFRKSLEAEGLTYAGKIYRDAAERVKEMDADEFKFRKYIFVGFNVLSASERSIFESLRKKGIADFYWDYASPQFKIKGNRASRFIKMNVKDFPSEFKEIGTKTLNYFPKVTVMSMPTMLGQAKIIPEILKGIYPEYFAGSGAACRQGELEGEDSVSADGSAQFGIDDSRLMQTAIILPEENLAQPILNSFPTEIPAVNVTMGFSLRHTSVASLIRSIVSLQLRARQVKQQDTFFIEDVAAVISHTLVRSRFASVCDQLMAEINEKRLFNVPVSLLAEPRFAPIYPAFEVVSNAIDSEAVLGYFERLLHWLESIILKDLKSNKDIKDIKDIKDFKDLKDINGFDGAGDGVGDGEDESDEVQDIRALGTSWLDLQFVRSYLDAIEQLNDLRGRYLKNIYLEDKTVFHLVERIVGNQSVNYEGQPLKGLQVMGVLESRCLDFSNVVLTSMNERIFPRKHYSKSFIPNALRRGYGMSTIEHQECIYAYYFYRMISRAENVYLLYDARKTGGRSGGPSRFIKQIRYQFPKENVAFTPVSSIVNVTKEPLPRAEKTPAVMAELLKFKSAEDPRYLSASSINSYINCPLNFYLTNIEKFYPENELVDYMEDSTYGTVVHDSLKDILNDAKGDAKELLLTPELRKQFSRPGFVEAYVTRNIKTTYQKKPADDPAPLVGDALIYCNVMSRTIRRMFERENELNEIDYFLQAEEKIKMPVKISAKHTINLSYTIDRVDRIEAGDNSTIRLIDYKTGSDKTSASKVERLFDDSQARPKAILQLLLYANAYAQREQYDGPIQPFIYQLRQINIEPLIPVKINKMPVNDYHEYNDQFLEMLDGVLTEMFDPNVPFVAFPGDQNHNCKYCKFKAICNIPE